MNLDGLHAFVVLAALLVRAVLPAYDAHARASADAAAGADYTLLDGAREIDHVHIQAALAMWTYCAPPLGSSLAIC